MRWHLHAGATADVLGAEVVDEAPGADHPALPLRQQPADGRIAPQRHVVPGQQHALRLGRCRDRSAVQLVFHRAHALSGLLVSGHARSSPGWWAIPPATIALYRLCGLRRARSAGGHRAGMSVPGQPGVAGGVLAGVVGVEVDEAALDEEVTDLEDVAPAARTPFGYAGPPGAVLVLAVAGALGDDQVGAGEDPGELAVVVLNGLQRAADVGEQLADLLAGGQAPLGEHDLGVVSEQVQDAAAGGRRPGVVEGLEVLEGDRLALLVGHRLGG